MFDFKTVYFLNIRQFYLDGINVLVIIKIAYKTQNSLNIHREHHPNFAFSFQFQKFLFSKTVKILEKKYLS